MKIFNKVLSVFLALLFVLALFPVGVFASEPWFEVGAETNEGELPVVTLKLDVDALKALLQGKEGETSSLGDGIALDFASLATVFTPEELFEIIPREDLLGIFSIEDILDQLEIAELEQYVDVNELAKEISSEDMEALLEEIEDLESVVDLPLALKSVEKSLLLAHINEDKLLEDLDPWDAVELLLNVEGFTAADLKSIIKLELLVSDGKLDWEDLVDFDLFSDDEIVDVVATYVTVHSEDRAEIEALLGGDSIDAYLNPDYSVNVAKVVAKVGVKKLIDSTIATVDMEGIMSDPIVDSYAFLHLKNTLDEVKKVLEPLTAQELEPYIFKDVVLDKIAIEDAVELIGGYDKAIEYLYMDKLLADPKLDFALLVPAVWLDKLVEEVGSERILLIIPLESIMAQFSNEEIYEIIPLLDLKAYTMPLLTLFLRKSLSAFDELSIDGTVVAAEDHKQMLQFDSGALLEVLGRILPSLEEFSVMEGSKLVSTAISFRYTANGTEIKKTKDLMLEVILEGDLTELQKTAARVSELLNRYVSYSLAEGELMLDVTLPKKVANLFHRVLDSNSLSESAKRKLLNLVNKTGDDLVGYLDELTAEDLVNMMQAIDIEKVERLALQNAYIQRALELASSLSGVDVTGLDPDALIDLTQKLPGIDTISQAIFDNYGLDLFEELSGHESLEEFYEAAQQLATENADVVEHLTNYVINLINTYVPEQYMDNSLMDAYNGNGSFALERTVTFNPKNIAEKLIGRAANALGLSEDKMEAIDLLLSQLSSSPKSVKLDLSLQLTDIYRVTYVDRSTNKELFKAFLPVGADLSIFQYQAPDGLLLSDWQDADGNAVETMPARDITLYAGRQRITVRFVDAGGNLMGEFEIYSGDTLAQYQTQIQEFENWIILPEVGGDSGKHVYDSYQVSWYLYDAQTGSAASTAKYFPVSRPFYHNTTLIAGVSPKYHLYIEDVDYDVKLDIVGENQYDFELTMNESLPEGFVLDLDRQNLVELAKGDGVVSLTIFAKDEKGNSFEFLHMDDVFLSSLAKAENHVSFDFKDAKDIPANAIGTVYEEDTTSDFYHFDVFMDDQEFTGMFEGTLTVTVPYTAIEEDGVATRVHILHENGEREYVKSFQGKSGYVSFVAPHFSDYVICKEYELDLNFVSTQTEDTMYEALLQDSGLSGYDSNDMYFPEGYVLTVSPALSSSYYTWVQTSYRFGDPKTEGTLDLGASFTMPAQKVEMTVSAAPQEYHLYYYVLGELLEKQTYFFYDADSSLVLKPLDKAEIMVKDPDGIPSPYQWLGFDEDLFGKADMHLYAKWDAAEYTVKFIVDGNTVATYGYTKENYQKISAPVLPSVAGKLYSWPAYDLTSVFNQAPGTVLEVVANPPTEIFYNITSDGLVTVAQNAKPGESVTVTAPAKEGFDAIIRVISVNNTVYEPENGAFVMPASDVYVCVVYQLKTFTYTTVDGQRGEGNAESATPFEIKIPRGKALASAPASCTLSACRIDENGDLILTYLPNLTEDQTLITWELKDVSYAPVKIFNGATYTQATDPASTYAGALFAGWSPVIDDVLQFATFTAVPKAASLLWLWILLAVIAVIALIALLYLLCKKGKISGKNPIARAIVWLVEHFFGLCMAFATAILKLFGYTVKEKEEPKKKETVAQPTSSNGTPKKGSKKSGKKSKKKMPAKKSKKKSMQKVSKKTKRKNKRKK